LKPEASKGRIKACKSIPGFEAICPLRAAESKMNLSETSLMRTQWKIKGNGERYTHNYKIELGLVINGPEWERAES